MDVGGVFANELSFFNANSKQSKKPSQFSSRPSIELIRRLVATTVVFN